MIPREERIFGLDVLRAAAILGVLFFHARKLSAGIPPFLESIFARGWMGVDLFFVLSGFLIGRQIFRASKEGGFLNQCRNFWIKRWTRTLLLYYVVLLTYVAIKPLIFHVPFYGGFGWKWLFFLQNFGEIKDFGPSWSLCIEEQFYLFFPLIALTLKKFVKWPKVFWLTPLFMSVVLRFLKAESLEVHSLSAENYLRIFRFQTWMTLDSISMGIFLAATYENWSCWNFRIRNAVGIFALLSFFCISYFFTEYPQSSAGISFMYFGLAISFGGLLVAFEKMRNPIRGLGILQPIALWSYSAYLWHALIVSTFTKHFHGVNWIVELLAFLGVTFCVSHLSYRWIERSGLALRAYFIPRHAGGTSYALPSDVQA